MTDEEMKSLIEEINNHTPKTFSLSPELPRCIRDFIYNAPPFSGINLIILALMAIGIIVALMGFVSQNDGAMTAGFIFLIVGWVCDFILFRYRL